MLFRSAVRALDKHLKGEKVSRSIVISIMAISKENISQKIPLIRKNVLGMEDKEDGKHNVEKAPK